jgi:hypothetical protein
MIQYPYCTIFDVTYWLVMPEDASDNVILEFLSLLVPALSDQNLDPS